MKSRFERSVEWVIVLFFSAFCLVMLSQIVGRSVFNASLFWSEEFARYSFIWVIMLASGLAVKRRAHVGFDLLVVKLPMRIQRVVHLVSDGVIGVFLLLFIFYGMRLVLAVGSTTSPSLKIPMEYVYLILPISALVMLVFLVENMWNHLKGKSEVPHEDHGDGT